MKTIRTMDVYTQLPLLDKFLANMSGNEDERLAGGLTIAMEAGVCRTKMNVTSHKARFL